MIANELRKFAQSAHDLALAAERISFLLEGEEKRDLDDCEILNLFGEDDERREIAVKCEEQVVVKEEMKEQIKAEIAENDIAVEMDEFCFVCLLEQDNGKALYQ
jgi:hypothetical protein